MTLLTEGKSRRKTDQGRKFEDLSGGNNEYTELNMSVENFKEILGYSYNYCGEAGQGADCLYMCFMCLQKILQILNWLLKDVYSL